MSSTDLEPVPHERAVNSFVEQLDLFMEGHGLPIDGIVAPPFERFRYLDLLPGTLQKLEKDLLKESLYLSKCTYAIAAGLFDAALNYLWNETIDSLRKKVSNYNLEYFFDLATSDTNKRKELKSEEDFPKLSDHDLLEACRKVGFISDLGHKQLDLIRIMRNDASAAHPNKNHLTALKLAHYTETCINEVITLKISPVMFNIKTLLRNIKEQTANNFDADRLSDICNNATKDQIESLAHGLFGIYVNNESNTSTRKNCELVLKVVWVHLPEPARQNIGLREARYAANLDLKKAALSAELLKNIGAGSYLPEDVRIKDIQQALEALKRAHYGWENFYNEPAPARQLSTLLADNPAPEKAQLPIVEVVAECFLGNGSGVSNDALLHYTKIIEKFTVDQAEYAMLLLSDGTFKNLLEGRTGRTQALKLVTLISPLLTSPSAKELSERFISFHTGNLEDFHRDTSSKKLAQRLADDLKLNEG